MSAVFAAESGSVVALCGGIGGAKLALGLSRVLPSERLKIVVNTGDDFRHFGLHVSPDIDTVIYTLSGRANSSTGWGRSGESWRFMGAVSELGGETWFSLGDTDLAMSAVRTARLQAGSRLTHVTLGIALALGVGPAILPATDDPVTTIVETDEGCLPFQQYFVGRRCEPKVRGICFQGANNARVTSEVQAALTDPDLAAVVICPSNPYLSIDPMLAVPGFSELLRNSAAPVVAVSPIVGGRSIKGPLAKMMGELGRAISPQTVAEHYWEFLDLLVIDSADAGLQTDGYQVQVAPTIMHSLDDKIELARTVLNTAPVRRTT